MNRKEARENVFILLFEKESREDECALEIFEYATVECGMEYDDYVKDVFFGINERRKEIDELLEPNYVGWKNNRISAASRAILALSAYEMLAREDIPARVSINEAIELSKKYDDEKSYVFVNGVLNAVREVLGLS